MQAFRYNIIIISEAKTYLNAFLHTFATIFGETDNQRHIHTCN